MRQLTYHVENDNVQNAFHVVLTGPGARCAAQSQSLNANGTPRCHMSCTGLQKCVNLL